MPGESEIPIAVSTLLQTTVRAFYSDSHIVAINILLKSGYASEYILVKDMGLSLEKIKMIMNSLYTEGYVRYEDRLFKQLKQFEQKNLKNIFRKIYKLRYWYIDFNFLVSALRNKVKEIIIDQKMENKTDKIFFLTCTRKICQKKFLLKELPSLTFNSVVGKFICDNFLNLKVICGAQLQEEEHNFNIKEDSVKKIIAELKPIINMILFSNNK